MIGSAHRLTIGKFVGVIFCDSDQQRQASKLFTRNDAETVADSLRELDYEPDSLQFSMNIPYIRTPDTQILIDGGLGQGISSLTQSLLMAGIEVNRIEHVVISHAHGDHVGGLVSTDGVLTYPRAQYHVWKEEWAAWNEAAQKPENAESVIRKSLLAIQDRVNLIDHEHEFLPGIHAIHTPGHTPGHMALLIESQGECLLHVVDAVHHPSQVVHTDWSPGFDHQPDLAAVTRRKLLERVADENLLMLAYHFPFPGLGHVARNGEQLQWVNLNP
jgi:glyoxylase-like metal-dependent hydrolase (beta-lactamase superfamily II)